MTTPIWRATGRISFFFSENLRFGLTLPLWEAVSFDLGRLDDINDRATLSTNESHPENLFAMAANCRDALPGIRGKCAAHLQFWPSGYDHGRSHLDGPR